MFVRLLVWVTVGRTVAAMLPLGFFLAAGDAAGRGPVLIGLGSAVTLGTGVALWPAGRVLDRTGRTRGMRVSLLLAAATLAPLGVGIAAGWPGPLLTATAVGAGACLSPLVSTPRALMPSLVPAPRRARASGLEAASFEVALVAAPIGAALAASIGPALLVAVCAVLLVVTAVRLPRHGAPTTPATGGGAALTAPVVRLAGLTALLGMSGGLLEPAVAQLPAPLPGVAGSNALLFVAMGLGSLGGGLVAAHTGWPSHPHHGAPLFALHALALVAAVASRGPLTLAVLMLAGVMIAPLTSLGGLHLDRSAPPARAAETFGAVTSVLVVATGVGQALAARLLSMLTPATLVLCASAPAFLAALALAPEVVRSRRDAGPGG